MELEEFNKLKKSKTELLSEIKELSAKVEELKHLKNWLECNHKIVLRDWNMKELTQQPKG